MIFFRLLGSRGAVTDIGMLCPCDSAMGSSASCAISSAAYRLQVPAKLVVMSFKTIHGGTGEVSSLPRGAGNWPSSEWVERRQQTRYRLHVPVSFTWIDRRGFRHRGEGSTRDIASNGMFVLAEVPPEAGTMVQIKGFFPPFEAWIERFRMEVRGRVLREERGEPDGLGGGFAVLNQTFVLRHKEFSIEG